MSLISYRSNCPCGGELSRQEATKNHFMWAIYLCDRCTRAMQVLLMFDGRVDTWIRHKGDLVGSVTITTKDDLVDQGIL